MLDSLARWPIAPDRVKFSVTGDCKAGSSADVQLASLHPKEPLPPGGPDDGEHVAVKKFCLTEESSADRALAVSDPFIICLLLQRGRRALLLQPLAHEVSLLAELTHPNIAQLRGFSEDFEKGVAWVVLPWDAYGNLREFLHSAEWGIPERVSLVRDRRPS